MTDTALTKREEREALIAKAPAVVQAGLEERRMRNAIAAEVARLSWGQNMSQQTARAVADWGLQHQVDVLTEVDVLGGKLYLNARFYIRKLADLIAAGAVEYAEADHVNADTRLEAWPEEKARRERERIKYQIPDEADGACVFRVKLKGMAREVVGVEWCGGKLAKGDPVGSAEPAKTSETRAARRAIRLIASHVPTLKSEVAEIEYAAAEIEPAIEDDIASIEPPRKMIPVPQPDDPYAPQAGAKDGDDARA